MLMKQTASQTTKGPQAILDAGSSKLSALIFETGLDGTPAILGHAMHASDGIRKGEVIDLDKFATAMGKTVQAAERNAGLTVSQLHITTSGGRPASHICRHKIELSDTRIGRRELRRLQSRLAESNPAAGHQIVQTQMLQYIVDDQTHVKNPIGMQGRKLAADYLLLSMSGLTLDNFRLAAAQNHLLLGEVHHSASLAGFASLDSDERELGCLQLDLGAGTSSVAIFMDGEMVFADSIDMGSHNITRDLAQVLSLSMADAERLKVIEGSVMPSPTLPTASLPFPATGDNFVVSDRVNPADLLPLSNGEVIERQLVNDIIRCRVEEILELVNQRIRHAGMQQVAGRRVTLSGGGAQLTGLADFVAHRWNKHVVLAKTASLRGSEELSSSLSHTAAFGMVRHLQTRQKEPAASPSNRPSIFNAFGRFGHWLNENI